MLSSSTVVSSPIPDAKGGATLAHPVDTEGTACEFIFPECKHAGAGVVDDVYGAVDLLKLESQARRIQCNDGTSQHTKRRLRPSAAIDPFASFALALSLSGKVVEAAVCPKQSIVPARQPGSRSKSHCHTR